MGRWDIAFCITYQRNVYSTIVPNPQGFDSTICIYRYTYTDGTTGRYERTLANLLYQLIQ